MGGIVTKSEEIIEGTVIFEDSGIYNPKNPLDDVKNKYIWLRLHTNDKTFVYVQKEGFCIVSYEKINGSWVWMRQKRNKPI